VVQTGPEDDHRLPVGLFGVSCELPRHGDDLFTIHAGDLFGPGGGVGAVVVEILGHPFAAKAPIQPVVGAEKVEHGGDEGFRPVGQGHAASRDVARQHLGVVAFHEITRRDPAEIGEIDAHNLIMVAIHDLAQAQLGIRSLGALLKVPLAFLTPAEPDGPVGGNDLARRLVIGDRLPIRIIGLA